MHFVKMKFFILLLTLFFIASSTVISPRVEAATGRIEGATATAYSEPKYKSDGTLTRTHSEKIPAWGMVAIHDNERSERPFGTTITITNTSIKHELYGSRTTFTIEDTGDYARNYLMGWIDVWFGFCTTCSKTDSVYDNKDRAVKFGNSTKVNYNYVTP